MLTERSLQPHAYTLPMDQGIKLHVLFPHFDHHQYQIAIVISYKCQMVYLVSVWYHYSPDMSIVYLYMWLSAI